MIGIVERQAINGTAQVAGAVQEISARRQLSRLTDRGSLAARGGDFRRAMAAGGGHPPQAARLPLFGVETGRKKFWRLRGAATAGVAGRAGPGQYRKWGKARTPGRGAGL